MEVYLQCLGVLETMATSIEATDPEAPAAMVVVSDLRGEIMIRTAILKKELGLVDAAIQICEDILGYSANDSLRAHAFCIKVWMCIFKMLPIFSG